METTKTISSTYTGSVTYIPVSVIPTTTTFAMSFPVFGSSGAVSAQTVTSVPKPQCHLPSPFVTCQEEWEQWATTSIGPIFGSTPACTQANITGSVCSTLVDVAAKNSHLNWGSSWPTSSDIAPGCNLGCGKCAVTVSNTERAESEGAYKC